MLGGQKSTLFAKQTFLWILKSWTMRANSPLKISADGSCTMSALATMSRWSENTGIRGGIIEPFRIALWVRPEITGQVAIRDQGVCRAIRPNVRMMNDCVASACISPVYSI